MASASLLVTRLAGRAFAVVAGKARPPRDPYVAHQGAFYPVTPKTGYPLTVLADIAAGQAGTLVLVPAEDGALAILSGSGRVVHLRSDPDSGQAGAEGFSRGLLRLMLLSDRQEVVTVGHIDAIAGMAAKKVELADLVLPPVIQRSRSWKLFGLFAGLVLLGVAMGSAVRSNAADSVALVVASKTSAESSMNSLLADVTTGRRQLAGAAKRPVDAKPPVATQVLPDTADSFMAQFYANPTLGSGTLIKVANGKIQF